MVRADRLMPLVCVLLRACVLLLPIVLTAQDRRLVPGDAPAGGRRLALVIGNDTYPGKPLVNARRDGRAIAAALRRLPESFEVTVVEDATQAQMAAAIARFTDTLTTRDVALFFYAGHGIAVEQENYLVPVDYAGTSVMEAKLRMIPASSIASALRTARVAVVVLDACRDNPFLGQRSANGGLTRMEARGTLIAYATGAGQTAGDNPGGVNGLFTQVLIKTFAEPGLTISEVFRRVRQEVRAATQDRQWPAVYDDLDGDVILRPAGNPPAANVPAMGAGGEGDLGLRTELALWEAIKDSSNVAAFEDYLRQYPSGRFKIAAEERAARARAIAGTPPNSTPESTAIKPNASTTAAARAEAMTRLFSEAVELTKANKDEEALAKFGEVITAVPRCAECYANIGTIQFKLRRYQEAEAAYRKAIDLKPDMAEAYDGLASVYNAEKKFDLAADASKTAVRLTGVTGGVTASATFNQGVILWNSGRIAEAKVQFEQAIRLDPSLADAHYWLGMALVNSGDLANAKTRFDSYLRLAPTGQYADTAKSILASIKDASALSPLYVEVETAWPLIAGQALQARPFEDAATTRDP